MISIEFAEPRKSVCDCCGNTTVRLTRFVCKDGGAHAVYYAVYTPEHGEKVASGLIGMGEWGDDDIGPEARAGKDAGGRLPAPAAIAVLSAGSGGGRNSGSCYP